jgi:hypothetical protein
LLLGFRVQFVAVLRSVWDSGKFAELQLCVGMLWILIYWRGLGFGFGFSGSEFPVLAWFSNLNIVGTGSERASCWKPFASYSRNIDDDDDDDDDVRGQAGRGAER